MPERITPAQPKYRKNYEFDKYTMDCIEEIVKSKKFRNESEAIRTAILLLHEKIVRGEIKKSYIVHDTK